MINKYLAICLIVIVAIVPISTINYNQFVKDSNDRQFGIGRSRDAFK